MTTEEQMNSLTRIILLIFLFLFVIDFRYDFLFLVSALLFIIIIYYIIVSLRKKSCRENYGPVETVFQPFPKIPWNSGTNDFVFANGNTNTKGCGMTTTPKRTVIQLTPNNSNPGLINTSDSLRWCPNEVPIEQTLSQNQKLVGPQNPKTLVQPVLSSRSHDFQVWTPNDFVVPTFLNEDRRQELYQNGYVPTPYQQFNVPVASSQAQQNIMESYDYMPYDYPTIDRTCGYDPNNLNYNLPINYNAARCEKTPEMAEYNRNLYTVPIQPGLNTFSQVNQPYASMSNLGISMATPFLPTEFNPAGTSSGQGLFTEESGAWPNSQPLQTPNYPLRSDIYDPRYSGYSANYRNYIDPMTGQPRFYYDDIDSQVQSNYITRNNIDFTQYAPQVGPASPSHYTNMEIRDMANNTYMDSVIQQRTELQQRLMHKNSNREWQLRKAPISRQNQARASGGKSNSGGGYAGPRG